MITRDTYFKWKASNSLPADKDIQDGDELIGLLTKNGKSWAAVDASDTYRELVDNHLKLLNSLVAPQKKGQSAASKARATLTVKKGRGVRRVKKTAKSDGKSFADRMKAARDAKRSKAKQSSDDQARPTKKSAAGTKQSSAKLKSTPKPKAETKSKPLTKTQQADAQYESAQKSGSLSEEIKQIRKFIHLVKKSTKEAIVNAAIALNKAVSQRKITKTSPYASEVEYMQAAYFAASKASPYKLAVSEQKLSELVHIAGGHKVYKSVELLTRFIGWSEKERTHEQVQAFLKQLNNAAPKIKAGDPYADQVKAVIRLLSSVKTKATFHLTKTPLSGLSGVLGCLCKGKKGLAGVATPGLDDEPTIRPNSPNPAPARHAVNDTLIAENGSGVRLVSPVAPAAPVGKPLPVKPRFPAVMSAHEVAAINYPTYDFKDDPKTNDWGTLIGKPQNPFAMMVSGEPGAGKSTLMMQLAVYLATHFGPTRYVSSEEYPSLTLADKLERAGGAVKGLSFSKDLSELSRDIKFLIIDSTNHVKLSLTEFLELRKKYPATSFILIMQYTKDGQFKGGNEWPHEVDAVFRVMRPGIVLTDKNRFVKEFAVGINVFKND